MRTRTDRRRRRGGAAVEVALVAPVLLLLIVGVLVLGLGVFRYQQLEALARESARWAAVHGPTYQSEEDAEAPTDDDLMEQVIAPRLVAMDREDLACTLSMSDGVASVTLTYEWAPEAYFGAIELSSTAASSITY